MYFRKCFVYFTEVLKICQSFLLFLTSVLRCVVKQARVSVESNRFVSARCSLNADRFYIYEQLGSRSQQTTATFTDGRAEGFIKHLIPGGNKRSYILDKLLAAG